MSTITRRNFIGAAASLLPAMAMGHELDQAPASPVRDRYDPWLEVDANTLHQNINVLSRLAGNRSIIAMVKNNAYGLGIGTAPKLLESHAKVKALGVVKTEECMQLLKAGVRKPILLLAQPDTGAEYDLLRHGIQICLFTPDALDRYEKFAAQLQQRLKVHVYIDTGMSRVGMPYHRAAEWLAAIAASPSLEVVSTFTDLTEDPEFDREQVRRLTQLADGLKAAGLSAGLLHAGSSHAVYHAPETHLDLVRPGLSLFGAYPSDYLKEKPLGALTTAYRWRARVVRVTELRAGDSVSYGRKFIADKPTWIATLPVGHADGYPRTAVKGSQVLINSRLYPVIGAVSASHTIVSLGSERTVNEGDIATLAGPDHEGISPDAVSAAAGISVYDMLMHMNPDMPKFSPQG